MEKKQVTVEAYKYKLVYKNLFSKDFGILVFVKWSCFAVGFEVVPEGLVLFFGPITIGLARVVDED